MNEQEYLALRKPFDRKHIGQLPKGGAKLDYVGHAAVTDRLLSVDPAWSWEPVAFDEQGLPAFTSGKGLWIRLTVCGVTRYGFGDGASVKECIGDAIRNAAMRFGVALDLWGKEELEQASGPVYAPAAKASADDFTPTPEPAAETPAEPADDGPKPITPGQLKALHASFNEAGITDRERRLEYCQRLTGREIGSSKDLTYREARMTIDALKADVEGSP